MTPLLPDGSLDPAIVPGNPEGIVDAITDDEQQKAVPLLRPALKVVDRLSPNFRPRPAGAEVNLIVVHYDESPRAAVTLAELLDPKSQKSYHALISRDSSIVYRIVLAENRADHAGVSAFDAKSTTYETIHGKPSSSVNDHSLGLCFGNTGSEDFPADQLQIGAAWIAYAMKKFPAISLDRVVGHSDVALPKGRKVDPGPRFPWDHFRYLIELEVAALQSQGA